MFGPQQNINQKWPYWQRPVDLHDITLCTVVIAMEMKEQDDESQRLWIIPCFFHEGFQSTITVIMLAQDRSKRNVIKLLRGIMVFEKQGKKLSKTAFFKRK